ncbi:MAG: hypothetical protein WD270_12095 [Acetobacterales bacterium]
MRVITTEEARRLATVEDSFATVEEAYRDYGRERRVLANPSAAVMIVPHEPPSLFIAKGAWSAAKGWAGARFGMQFGNYYNIVCESREGRILGLVEETWLTQRRVGVTAGVAAKHLAAPGVKTVALIGAGQLNSETYLTMPHVFPEARFRIASRSFDGAKRFADEFGRDGPAPLEPVESAEAAVDGADVVVTITLADTPPIRPGMLKKGATMLSMGGVEEVSFDCLPEFDRLIVDDIDYAMLRGDLATWVNAGRISRKDVEARIDADIGEVVIGAKPGRTSPDETILGIIQGMAVCDVAMAKMCIDKGADAGVGTVVESMAQSPGRKPPEASRAGFVATGLKTSRGMK